METSNLTSVPPKERSRAPITKLSRFAARVQQSVALAVVAIPIVGLIAAVVLALQVGIGWMEFGILAAMYILSMLGITIGFHRYFAHCSFDTSVPMRHALAILGSMAAQGPLLFWVATHRRHHAYSDEPGDPHSPNLHGGGWRGLVCGLWHAHVGWMFSSEVSDWTHFGRDLLSDRDLFRLHRWYPTWVALGMILPALAGGVIAGSWLGVLQGFLWGGPVRVFLVNHAAWCVGSICHLFGTRPFATHDHSANNHVVALLTFGEGLQNNHHAFPSSYSHAVVWWEPDLSARVLRLMKRLGLVWNLKYPSPRVISESRVGT